LEDSLKIAREAHSLHAKAINGMAKGNDVEALTMEQAQARFKRSEEAEEKNGIVVTLAFSMVPTDRGIKTFVVVPEIRSKIPINSGDFIALYFQLKWDVVAQSVGDSQSIVETDPTTPLIVGFCIWDIGTNTIPGMPFPERTKNLQEYRTDYQLFPNKEKNAKRKAARKKANDAKRESERASTSTSASTSTPTSGKDELD